MATKRDIYAEIKAVKQRDEYQHGWRLISGLEKVISKFQSLHNDKPKSSLTFFEYLPVTAVSCFESYFRIKVQELLALGEPYLGNSKRLADVISKKFNLFDFVRFDSDEIGIEDVIVHSLSFSSFESINATFSTLLDKDFFTDLKEFIPVKPIPHFYEIAAFFKRNIEDIFRDVALTYKLRNIYCHEFNALIEVKEAVLLRYTRHCVSFLEKTEIYFNHIIYPNPQVELNDKQKAADAKRQFSQSQLELDNLIAKMLSEMYDFGMDTDLFHENLMADIALWKKYRQKTTKQWCEIYESCKRYQEFYWNQMEEITREKIFALTAVYNKQTEPIHKYNQIEKFT